MEVINSNIASLGGKVVVSPFDILDPRQFSAQIGGSAALWLEPRYFFGKDVTLPANNTAIGNTSPDTRPLDLSGIHIFGQTNSSLRPLFKTSEGFPTVQGNGLSNYLLSNNTNITSGATSWLTAVKFKPISTAYQILVYHWYPGLNQRVFMVFSNGNLVFQCIPNPTVGIVSAPAITGLSQNIYHTAVFTYTPSTGVFKSYLNGMLVGTSTFATAAAFNTISEAFWVFGDGGSGGVGAFTGHLNFLFEHKNGAYTDEAVMKLSNYIKMI